MRESSAFSRFLFLALLVAGWALAAWLGWDRLSDGRLDPIPLAPGRPAEAPEEEIAGIFRKWSEDPSLAGASLGFCVLDEDGRTLFASPLAETALCPASALKTLTTGAAFSVLGPEFRFETTLAAAVAPDAAGVSAGDLVLVGSGDPTLSAADLERLADAVADGGLKEVKGGLRVDASVFPGPPVNDHWNWGDIGNAYGAGAFGLNVNRNRMTIRFSPGARTGDPAKVSGTSPAFSGFTWRNRVLTGPAGSGDRVVVYSEPHGRSVTLLGTVPLGEEGFSIGAAIPDPAAVAAEIVTKRLRAAGVRIADTARGEGGGKVVLARHHSAPLPEIVDHLHRVSDNVEAQCLFLTMGRLRGEDPARVVRGHWETAGVTFSGLRLIDGSGLARANMIRPLDLARVNRAALHGPHGERYLASLSSYLGGSVRSKLGAMSGVKTDAGFLLMPDGRRLTFALMANGLDPSLDFWPLRTRLLEAVLGHRSGSLSPRGDRECLPSGDDPLHPRPR